jgi:hypothetical protein
VPEVGISIMKPRSSFNKRHRRGFDDSHELLIVIAIIGMALAILLPFFHASIDAAKRAGHSAWIGIIGGFLLIGAFFSLLILCKLLFDLIRFFMKYGIRATFTQRKRVIFFTVVMLLILLSSTHFKSLLIFLSRLTQ